MNTLHKVYELLDPEGVYLDVYNISVREVEVDAE